MSDYLLQTPACFYFRMKVPQELRSVLQKREIKKSLKTESKQRASRLAAIYAIRCQDMFDALKGRDIRPTSLSNVCRYLGLRLNPHEVLSDAEACVEIVLAAYRTGATI